MDTKRFIYFSIEIFSEYSGIITDIFRGTLDELKKHLNIINDDKHSILSVEKCFVINETSIISEKINL